MSEQTSSSVVRRGYVNGCFGQMHYRMAKPDGEPSARPLFCFHMSPYSSVIYERFLAEMGRDRIAVAVDTPGFGESDPPPDVPALEEYASAMGDVLDTLDPGRGDRSIDVMGYHTGSKIAVELALQRPQQIHRVVMVSAPIWTKEELPEHRSQYAATPLTEDGSHLAKWWQASVYWSMEGRTLADIGRVFHARVMRPDISWWGHNAAYGYDTAAALPRVAQPILVLNPEDDLWEMTPRAATLLAHSQSRIHDLPGWSHGFLDLKTAETATLVRRFLDLPAD